MANFSILIQKGDRRKDGRYPIYIRVYWKSKSANIHTNLYAAGKQLTKDLRLKDPTILREVTGRIARYEALKLELGFHISAYTAKELADFFVRRTAVSNAGISITEYAAKLVEKLTLEGRTGTAQNIKITMRNICRFVQADTLYFSDITVKFLQDYEKWMLDNGMKGRGVSLYMGYIRQLFNLARYEYNDENRGDIQIPNYPFLKYKIPKAPEPEKRALAVEQIQAIRDYVPAYTRDALAKDLFMLSFYLVGMNSVDLFHCPPPKAGRITYNRAKTKGRRADKAKISIKIEPEAQSIIEKYAGDERLLNLHKRYKNKALLSEALSRGMRTIGKTLDIPGLTFYAARHSWATIAINDCDIPKSDVHEALNHVDEKMKITDVYIKKDWSRIDKANRKVLDFLEKRR
ncbi:MAG: site-specific integrase [Prevotellaceae bacterium]|jgi:integrase|nr:site-specific integrase [Prevotellaceae bacterium]